MTKQTCIISLGGSLIAPLSGIDWRFLKKFRVLILSQIKLGNKFYIIAGGGATARNYIQAANKVVELTRDDLDWLGIHSTRLNAHLLRTVFRNEAHPEIITNPTRKIQSKKKIIIASGYRPGNSTDYVATLIAEGYDAKKIINLSNINYVCDKDPRKFKEAKKQPRMDWPAFRKLAGDKWDPGLNAPFDPIASKKSQELKLEVAIMNGKKLKNLENYLAGKKFIGTVIKD